MWLLGSEWQHTDKICSLLLSFSCTPRCWVYFLTVLFSFGWLMGPAAVCYCCHFSSTPSVRKTFLRAFRGFYMEKLIVMSVHFPVSWLSLFTMCLVSFPSACFQFGCWLNLNQLLGCLLFGGCLALSFTFATFGSFLGYSHCPYFVVILQSD